MKKLFSLSLFAVVLFSLSDFVLANPLQPIQCNYRSSTGEAGWAKFKEENGELIFQYQSSMNSPIHCEISETNENRVVASYKTKAAGPFPSYLKTIIIDKGLMAVRETSEPETSFWISYSDCSVIAP